MEGVDKLHRSKSFKICGNTEVRCISLQKLAAKMSDNHLYVRDEVNHRASCLAYESHEYSSQATSRD
jgi:hypothetical protein